MSAPLSTTDRVRMNTKARADQLARDRRWQRTEAYEFAFDVIEHLKPEELERVERRINTQREHAA